MDFQITAEDVKEALDRGEKLTLVDVREPWEFELSHLEGAKLIPMGDVPSRAAMSIAGRRAVCLQARMSTATIVPARS